MQFISLLGLITLLALSWAISFHPRKVRLRPLCWGLALQFTLALIILRTDWLSQAALVAFALLLCCYILKDWQGWALKPPVSFAAAGILALAAIGVLYAVDGALPLEYVLAALLAVLVANGFFFKKDAINRFGGVLLIAAGVAVLFANDVTSKDAFRMFSDRVESFLALSDYGAEFLFGNLAREDYFNISNEYFPGFGMLFAFKVLPTIIFFGGFMSVLYYLGVIQKVISAMSRFMRWTMGTSGAESLSCSANIFVGQTEAPLLIKPFLDKMTKSELLTIMVGGFATIAGGVLAGYINMGVDAGHLIAASVMSAPAALAIGKTIYPETEHSETAGDVPLPELPVGDNVLEAASNGISDGFKLALNVGAMLIGFIALIAVADVLLNWLDGIIDGQLLGGQMYEYAIQGSSPVTSEYAGVFPGSLQTFFGTLLSPLAWLMGVPWEDAAAVGNLLGVKLSVNEFVAFGSLGQYINDGAIGERAQIVSTYALCGFANFSSIGIQLGGIGAIIRPDRKPDLAKVVMRAMIGGAFASWTTACIASMLLI